MFAGTGSDFDQKKTKIDNNIYIIMGKTQQNISQFGQFTRAKPYSIIKYSLYHCTFHKV
jgi:hypothetical protein